MRLVPALVAALTLTGCSPTPSIPLPPPPTVLDVGMTEFRFEVQPDIPTGRVVIRAANRGRVAHQLVLTRLPADLPPLDAQLHSDARRPLETLRTLPSYDPGQAGTFAVDLAPGRYGFLCFLQEPGDTVSHALHGMNTEVTVR